jgi:hypothetical protein
MMEEPILTIGDWIVILLWCLLIGATYKFIKFLDPILLNFFNYLSQQQPTTPLPSVNHPHQPNDIPLPSTNNINHANLNPQHHSFNSVGIATVPDAWSTTGNSTKGTAYSTPTVFTLP